MLVEDLEAALVQARQRLSVINSRIAQQERIVSGLREGPGRVEALSALTALLRDQYDHELKLQELDRQLHRYILEQDP